MFECGIFDSPSLLDQSFFTCQLDSDCPLLPPIPIEEFVETKALSSKATAPPSPLRPLKPKPPLQPIKRQRKRAPRLSKPKGGAEAKAEPEQQQQQQPLPQATQQIEEPPLLTPPHLLAVMQREDPPAGMQEFFERHSVVSSFRWYGAAHNELYRNNPWPDDFLVLHPEQRREYSDWEAVLAEHTDELAQGAPPTKELLAVKRLADMQRAARLAFNFVLAQREKNARKYKQAVREENKRLRERIERFGVEATRSTERLPVWCVSKVLECLAAAGMPIAVPARLYQINKVILDAIVENEWFARPGNGGGLAEIFAPLNSDGTPDGTRGVRFRKVTRAQQHEMRRRIEQRAAEEGKGSIEEYQAAYREEHGAEELAYIYSMTKGVYAAGIGDDVFELVFKSLCETSASAVQGVTVVFVPERVAMIITTTVMCKDGHFYNSDLGRIGNVGALVARPDGQFHFLYAGSLGRSFMTLAEL